jgi:hypothetical protein
MVEPVDPIVAVRTLLLREALPDLALRPGASVVARVASRGEQMGVLVLAGVPLTAQLPEAVRAGETLRLRVTDVTPERVTLQLEPPQGAPVGQPPPPARQDAPRVAVGEPPRRRLEGGEAVDSVALAFTSDALGRLDLRIDLRAGSVQVTVDTPGGQVQDLAHGEAPRLRDGLVVKVGREAAVDVRPRRESVDFYA